METLTTKLEQQQNRRASAELTSLECKALNTIAGYDVAKLADIAGTLKTMQEGINLEYFGYKPSESKEWLLKSADFDYYAAQANAVSLLLEQMQAIITDLQAAAEQGYN